MTEKHLRVKFLDSDEKENKVVKDSQVLGRNCSNSDARFNTRAAAVASMADFFSEDRILEKLPQYARLRYQQLVPAKLSKEYAESLAGVMRWRGNNGDQLINPEFQENNLEHVLELIEWMNEIENHYPLLWQEVCQGDRLKWMDLMGMLIIHDSGEIIVGDIQRSDPEFYKEKGIRHKKKEAIMAKRLIRKNLPEKADLLLGYYERYDKRESTDKLVVLGHILDKAQAAQNVAKHILPFNSEREDFDLGSCYFTSQSAFLEYAEHLTLHISEQARRELLVF